MKRLVIVAVLLYAFGSSWSARADALIYEPFDYPTTGTTAGDGFYLGDGSQGGGVGLVGTWTQQINTIEMEVWPSGMTFTDDVGRVLGVAGNRAYRSARAGYMAAWRQVDSVASAVLTADNSTMWMSFLYVDEGPTGPDSSVTLTSVLPALANNHTLSASGYGIGILIGENTASEATSAVESGYYLNSAVATRGTSTLYPGTTEGQVYLLAAKINWRPSPTPDEIFVFNITNLTSEPLEVDAIASDTFDMSLADQQSLQYLNIVETQVDAFDEIRFGQAYLDVIGMHRLAGTTFDGRARTTTRVANDTASSLDWVVDGLLDPGPMAAREEGGGGVSLLNGAVLTTNSFSPDLNVGWNNTFWWTDVPLTVAPGVEVSITDVEFDYLPVNASQVYAGAAKPADFSVALYGPGFDTDTLADWPMNGQPGSPIEDVVFDGITNAGGQPVRWLTATFSSPVDLALPGTYTLRIVSADGGHAGGWNGIDNLSIYGPVTLLPTGTVIGIW